jgi:hypothetical protein
VATISYWKLKLFLMVGNEVVQIIVFSAHTTRLPTYDGAGALALGVRSLAAPWPVRKKRTAEAFLQRPSAGAVFVIG